MINLKIGAALQKKWRRKNGYVEYLKDPQQK